MKPRKLSQGWGALVVATVLAIALFVWGGGSDYRLGVITLGVSYSLIALGMYMPLAWGGSLSLAYGAYAAIGAYGTAYLAASLGLPGWLGWILGPIVAAALAIVLGLVTSRLSSDHLAAVTLLFATAFQTWLISSDALGGPNGIGGVPPLSVFGWKPSALVLTIGGVIVVLVIGFAIDRVRRSDFGILVRALGETPVAVEGSGTRVPRITIVILALGAAIASLGGAAFATSVRGITPETFTVQIVFLVLFMPLIGGLATPWGAIVGAAIVVELTVNSSLFSGNGSFVLSIAVLAILVLAPQGVLGYFANARSLFGRMRSLSRRTP
ncbi:hypothetical protein B7R54_04235 [Subtercola boreus]|uniref:Branched-chain amino acid ABC transporter permease n=1 Tax=Subtercola boreus TaxID=120213 RepID=A0A3E0VFT2_9MICO|nr:branched-chain amino acid ABC transporter permease [Subtercola boreus]RFA08519.1 hypothetical protein B7R54_04235 [Subtercola boreus]TQL54553.1 amino acid/amide ABC transporter membrane protein 2 (HAAT family) [Subtercola boreus]